MTSSSGNPFDDIFGQSFLGGGVPRPPAKKQPEKGPNGGWRAKVIDGEHYVPMSQVADMLENNNILPGMKKRLRDHISAYKLKMQEGQRSKVAGPVDESETGLCSGELGKLHPACTTRYDLHEIHTVEVKK